MRHGLRFFPAILGILVPLGALAWLGSLELGRQSERAERAVVDHALTFLRDASRALEAEIIGLTHGVDHPPDIDFRPLVEIDQQLLRGMPHAEGLVALDESAGLLHPAPPPTDASELPFHRWEPTPEVRTAEQLIAIGDLEGARDVLESYLERGGRRAMRSGRSRQRAYFRLATVLRRLGDLDGAEEQFVAATRQRFVSREAEAVELLCDVSLAEIDASRGAGPERLAALAQRIAAGEHYESVGDGLLSETVLYLRDVIPGGTEEHAAAAAAAELDRVRRLGRGFATDYVAYSRESVRRQLRALGEGQRLYAHQEGPAGRFLIVLRRIADAEREQAFASLRDAEWIGIRFDLESVLRAALSTHVEPASESFYLAIESPEGRPILPAEPPELESTREFLPTHRSLAGLTLRAEPADPRSLLAQRQASIRNRALLIGVLCVLGLGGVLLLVRSVIRESEVAALKMSLLSRVSHELKTPLALIKMYAETLERGRAETPEQVAKFTGIITREVDRLTAMIQRVLDFSRRRSGEAGLALVETDLSELTESVTREYEPSAASRGVPLSVTVEPGVTARVDRDAFESALLNLLDNAVKYTREAQSNAAVEVVLRSDAGHAVIEVSDRGIGVPEDELTRVFTSFYRARNAGETPGAGIGLSLVKAFADGHAGSARAFARPGGGASFRLSIPQRKSK